jgi:histidine decarboxylase
MLEPVSKPLYISSVDSTLSGSRNAFSPILLWDYLARNTDEDISNIAHDCFELAKSIEKEVRKIMDKKNK